MLAKSHQSATLDLQRLQCSVFFFNIQAENSYLLAANENMDDEERKVSSENFAVNSVKINYHFSYMNLERRWTNLKKGGRNGR